MTAIYDDPEARFKAYCDILFGPGVVGLINGTHGQGDFSITFGTGVSQTVKDQVMLLADTNTSVWGGWAPLVVPDYVGFKHDIITHPSAAQYPIAIIMAFAVAEPTLNYADRKTAASKLGDAILAAYPTQGANILSVIQAFAVARNLPLV